MRCFPGSRTSKELTATQRASAQGGAPGGIGEPPGEVASGLGPGDGGAQEAQETRRSSRGRPVRGRRAGETRAPRAPSGPARPGAARPESWTQAGAAEDGGAWGAVCGPTPPRRDLAGRPLRLPRPGAPAGCGCAAPAAGGRANPRLHVDGRRRRPSRPPARALPALGSAAAEARNPRGGRGRGPGAAAPDGDPRPLQVRVRPGPVRGLGRRRPGHPGRLVPLLHVPRARAIQQQPATLPARPLGGCPRVRLSLHCIPGRARRAQGAPPAPARLGP